MLNDILKLNRVKVLDKNSQKHINGGQGNCAVVCNSGTVIHNVPNMNDDTLDWACSNQGGHAGIAICVGEEIPWTNPRLLK